MRSIRKLVASLLIQKKPGDTPFHVAARNCNSEKEFLEKISHLSNEEKLQYAVTVNDEGKLAFECINDQLSDTDKQSIFSKLTDFALMQKIPKLSDPVQVITPKDIHPISSLLLSNLKIGYYLATAARFKILQSATHPQMNGCPLETLNRISRSINSHRVHKRSVQDELLLQHAEFKQVHSSDPASIKIDITISKELGKQLAENKFDSIGDAGNCSELATVVANFAQGLKRTTEVYRYKAKHGDHGFDAIDLEISPKYDASKPETWGKYAVISDPWAGQVFPAICYKEYLGDYKDLYKDGKPYNLITRFNPNFNIIEKAFFYKEGTFTLSCSVTNSAINQLLARASLSNAKEQYLFMHVIKRYLKKAIKRKLITEAEIKNWREPYVMLAKYFKNDISYLPLTANFYGGDEDLLLTKLESALKNGVDVNHAFEGSQSALYLCTEMGLKKAVAFLLQSGAKQDINGYSPVFNALRNRQFEVAELLLLKEPALRDKQVLLKVNGLLESFKPGTREHNYILNKQKNSQYVTMTPNELISLLRPTQTIFPKTYYPAANFFNLQPIMLTEHITDRSIPSEKKLSRCVTL